MRASCQVVDPHNPDFGEQLSASGQTRRMTSKFRSQGNASAMCSSCTCWQVKKHHICKMPSKEKAMTVHFWHSELSDKRLSYVKEQKTSRMLAAIDRPLLEKKAMSSLQNKTLTSTAEKVCWQFIWWFWWKIYQSFSYSLMFLLLWLELGLHPKSNGKW